MAGNEWDKLVTSESTVVIYMPGQEYAKLADQLMSAGLQGDTPCVVVSKAGSQFQQLQWSDLASSRIARRCLPPLC